MDQITCNFISSLTLGYYAMHQFQSNRSTAANHFVMTIIENDLNVKDKHGHKKPQTTLCMEMHDQPLH